MNALEKLLHTKHTENGDISYTSTGNHLLDLLFLSSYFENHLDEVSIGTSPKEELFARFVRDPRFGLGRRDFGRELMKQAGTIPEMVVQTGRFDDLLYIPTDKALAYWKEEIQKGNVLAKKWAPRLTGKHKQLAKALAKEWGMSEKEYRAFIKCEDTVEYKLSYAEEAATSELEKAFNKVEYTHPFVDTIDFEKVPSLALLKYYHLFQTDERFASRFAEYLDGVQKGEKKMNMSVTNVYDLFKLCVENSYSSNYKVKEEADTLFAQFPQVPLGSILPIVDNSGSMYDGNDSQGKAKAVGMYVSRNSSYMPGKIVAFGSKPQVLDLGDTYASAMKTLYSYNDCGHTDFGKVMDNLAKMTKDFPEYLLVLSDMEFDAGSATSKNNAMRRIRQYSPNTKIIWWNFNTRNKTVPETDNYGNIFMSGYSPMLLQYLECGFDGAAFLDKLLEEYAKKIT